jgi:Zn finger protein HypA/HybF involved in hydrogenase expression
MIATLGEAFDAGWRLRVYCREGRRDHGKSSRECRASLAADIETLVWTRGRAFPVSSLETRMRCPRCGSRRVSIAFEVPRSGVSARA